MTQRVKKGEEVLMTEIPPCDLCRIEVDQGKRPKDRLQDAWCDGATSMGAWAYMCHDHFVRYGVGLGEGRGQKLVLREPEPTDTEMMEKLARGERGFGTVGDVMEHKKANQVLRCPKCGNADTLAKIVDDTVEPPVLRHIFCAECETLSDIDA